MVRQLIANQPPPVRIRAPPLFLTTDFSSREVSVFLLDGEWQPGLERNEMQRNDRIEAGKAVPTYASPVRVTMAVNRCLGGVKYLWMAEVGMFLYFLLALAGGMVPFLMVYPEFLGLSEYFAFAAKVITLLTVEALVLGRLLYWINRMILGRKRGIPFGSAWRFFVGYIFSRLAATGAAVAAAVYLSRLYVEAIKDYHEAFFGGWVILSVAYCQTLTFLGGCLALGGWLIITYRMRFFEVIPCMARIFAKNIPMLCVLFFGTLIGGFLCGVVTFFLCLMALWPVAVVVCFGVATYVLLGYVVFYMMAAGEEIQEGKRENEHG